MGRLIDADAFKRQIILPSVFLAMDEQEKAFVIASIKIKMEKDKEEEERAKREAKRRGRR